MRLLIYLILSCTAATALGQNLIYQAFNMNMANVKAQLPELKKLGFTHVLISPIQKTIPSNQWWARYQPVDFRIIDGPLGNENDIKNLVTEARSLGLWILVDVVLNHMASTISYPNLIYPEFNSTHFHFPFEQPCIQDWNNRTQVTQYWLCSSARDIGKLPDLNTSDPFVKNAHRFFLKKLSNLGVQGLRIDAAKHIEPEYFTAMESSFKPFSFVFGEVVGTSESEENIYTHFYPITDYRLITTLIRTFSDSGDIRSLSNLDRNLALPGNEAVSFSKNHDTVMGHDFFRFANDRDALLAQVFLLFIRKGHQFIFKDDILVPEISNSLKLLLKYPSQIGITFSGKSVCDSCDTANLLFFQKGREVLGIINKSKDWFKSGGAYLPNLDDGAYNELNYGFKMTIFQSRIVDWAGTHNASLEIGPKSVLLFQKVSPPIL